MKSYFSSAIFAVLFAGPAGADEKSKAPVPPTAPPAPLASLDIGNTADGAYPGGATPLSGTWFVEKSAKKLRFKTEPLVTGWLEFGPEIRGKGATISVLGRAPGEGLLRSRMGAGLYGKNGFQIRLDQGKQVVELVRRGIVLESVKFDSDPAKLYEIELNVLEEGENWIVTGRVWEYETERPGEALLSHRAYTDELLFPLAGRACLVATPFSGESVQYAIARVYSGDPFAPVVAEEEGEGVEE